MKHFATIGSIGRARYFLLRLSRSSKRKIILAVDIVLAAACLSASILIVNEPLPTGYAVAMLIAWACFSALLSSNLMGIYRSITRYVGVDFLPSVLGASVTTTLLLMPALLYCFEPMASARIGFAFANFLIVGILGTRFSARVMLNKRAAHRERVIIYGAGRGGMQVATSLSGSSKFVPLAFVDDDSRLIDRRIAGLDVLNARDLPRILVDLNVKRVLLAMPSASRSRRREIINRLAGSRVRVQTIPDMSEILSGAARIDDIQDVAVEDLLGRDPVPPDIELLEQENTDRVVLVTGAGGSIGSELCRKLVEVGPSQLLLVEQSEIALYTIERQLRKDLAHLEATVEIVALLGSVTDKVRMREIMEAYDVDTVYHAAAYKHVPIVEHNVLEGVANNVMGTLAVAEAAVEAAVKTFVLISTDKAVSPTNVMGASKRLAELILQDLDKRSRTTFCMVRFGNVLASSGSVVPLFREQIRTGGPVTVTHPEIIRYFMTIPEAAQLVIQAGAMAKGGDVFVLDMGKPVKIVDLATKMIQLMGKTVRSEDNPAGEIEIAFTGLRPAEKLYEELLIGSDVSGTSHPRIMRANEQALSTEQLKRVLDDLRQAMEARDWQLIRELLLNAVEGYSPTGGIEDHIYTQTESFVTDEANVTSLDRYRRPD